MVYTTEFHFLGIYAYVNFISVRHTGGENKGKIQITKVMLLYFQRM